MKDPEKRNQQIKREEDDISAAQTDANDMEKPADDAFKTANRKHRLGWEVPHDEQMFDNNSLSDKGGDEAAEDS